MLAVTRASSPVFSSRARPANTASRTRFVAPTQYPPCKADSNSRCSGSVVSSTSATSAAGARARTALWASSTLVSAASNACTASGRDRHTYRHRQPVDTACVRYQQHPRLHAIHGHQGRGLRTGRMPLRQMLGTSASLLMQQNARCSWEDDVYSASRHILLEIWLASVARTPSTSRSAHVARVGRHSAVRVTAPTARNLYHTDFTAIQ